jgi:hypothetical protein
VNLKVAVLWYVMPSNLIERYQHFLRICCHNLQSRETTASSEMSIPVHWDYIWCQIPEDSNLHSSGLSAFNSSVFSVIIKMPGSYLDLLCRLGASLIF